MENNLENKAKFFAQYFNSQAIWRTSELNENVDEVTWELKNFKYLNETDYLELKPFSSITDEDAKKIGFRDSDHFKFDASPANWKDELRLLGYAVEWVNLSVEKQLEYGWIKLKNN